jgi:hypothetical protein
MKKALLTTVAALAFSATSAQTMPPASITAQSVSAGDAPAWTEEAASKVAADYQAAVEKLRTDKEQARKELEKIPAYAASAETAVPAAEGRP